MGVSGWAASDHLITADPTPRFQDPFTGTDGSPPDPLKWQDDSVGSGLADIQGNRLRMVTQSNTVLTDPVRLVALMTPLGDQRVELPVEIPNEACRYSLYLRAGGVWDVTTIHHQVESYQLYIQRDGVGGTPHVHVWRHSGGSGVQIAGPVNVGSGSTTNVRIRFQAVGASLRAEFVDGLGAFTGTWTLTTTDGTPLPAGVIAMTNGGNTGATPTIFVDDVQVFYRTALWPGAEPYGKSLWLYVPSSISGTGGMHLYDGEDTTSDSYRGGFVNPDNGNFNACSRAVPIGVTCATFNPIAEDQWLHASMGHISNTLRETRVGAAGVVSNTTSVPALDPVISAVGTDPAGEITPALNPGIGIASISYWDLSGFTLADRNDWDAELRAGRNPLAVNADNTGPWFNRLVNVDGGGKAYAELIDTSDLGPYWSSEPLDTFLVGGNPSHPPVDPAPAGGGALLLLHHYEG